MGEAAAKHPTVIPALLTILNNSKEDLIIEISLIVKLRRLSDEVLSYAKNEDGPATASYYFEINF